MVNQDDLGRRFGLIFDGAEPVCVARAPGRVNLIGEHTDYNDGFVLPMAMSQALYVAAAPGAGSETAVHATAYEETVRFDARYPGGPGEPAWANYVRGVAALLKGAGIEVPAARLLIHSDVPIGGGVSSSAALEVGTALALLTLAGRMLEPIPLALLARRAEHEWAGSPCGIMDQFICVLGQAHHALLLDCRSQEYEQVPVPDDDACLVVMNTQVKHEIGSSEYPVRQQQCREGVAAIRGEHPDVVSLRDVTPTMLEGARGKMDEVAFRRCRHVVGEIARTTEAADALRAGDLGTFGARMFDSHASLRDDYEVSCPELDALVDVAGQVPGVYGVRMTGGGFGGCAIALARRDAEETVRAAIRDSYDPQFDKPAIVYTTTASDGASVSRL